jgi:hypothetical protein
MHQGHDGTVAEAVRTPEYGKDSPLRKSTAATAFHRATNHTSTGGLTGPRHTHGGDEFLYLLDCEGSVEIDGVWRLLPPDTALSSARSHDRRGRHAAARKTAPATVNA